MRIDIEWLYLLAIPPWLMGVVLAKSTVSTIAAVVLPPYAWYLLTEQVMKLTGLLQ